MNSKDPLDRIDQLLRARQPDPRPSPMLEARILGSLKRARAPQRPRRRGWLIFPPALAAVVVLLWPDPAAPVAGTARHDAPPSEVPSSEPAGSSFPGANPLHSEARALQRDARRAGRFLIDSLPSIGIAER